MNATSGVGPRRRRRGCIPRPEHGAALRQGLAALERDNIRLARFCFEQVAGDGGPLLALSCLAYCRAREGHGWREAHELCREALRREPGHPLHHLMLGRICLLAGEKEGAVTAFSAGLNFGYHPALVRELERMGLRHKPFFRFLDRRHLLNRCCGLLLSRLGLRPLLHAPLLSSWQT